MIFLHTAEKLTQKISAQSEVHKQTHKHPINLIFCRNVYFVLISTKWQQIWVYIWVLNLWLISFQFPFLFEGGGWNNYLSTVIIVLQDKKVFWPDILLFREGSSLFRWYFISLDDILSHAEVSNSPLSKPVFLHFRPVNLN